MSNAVTMKNLQNNEIANRPDRTLKMRKKTLATNKNYLDVINDTKKWVVIVDRFYGTFDSRKDAYLAAGLIKGHIDDSPFGCIFVLPPDFVYEDIYGNKATALLSAIKEIDIVRYIKKNLNKKIIVSEFESLAQRYKAKKEFMKAMGF